MADSIAQALANEFAKQRAGNIAINAGANLAQQKIETAPGASFGDRLLAAMMPGLIGGIAHGAGSQYEETRQSAMLDSFARDYVLPDDQRMAAMRADETLAPLAPYVQMLDMERAQALADQYKKSAIERQAQMLTEMNLAIPYERSQVQAKFYGQMGEDMPIGPADEMQGDGVPSVAAAGPKWVNPYDNPEVKRVDELRQEFYPSQENKYLIETQPIVRSLAQSWYDKTPAGDLDFVIGTFKILDPDSIVRESEGEQVKKTQAIPEWAWGLFQKAKGGAGIGDDARAKLLKLAANRYEGMRIGWQQRAGLLQDEAMRAGIEPGRITGPTPLAFEEMMPREIWGYVARQKDITPRVNSDIDTTDPDTMRNAKAAFGSQLKVFAQKGDTDMVDQIVEEMRGLGFSDDEILRLSK
jgi:hypothetical protein